MQNLTRRAHGKEDSQDYHGLRLWLLDLVYAALCDRHLQFEKVIETQMRFMDGIVGLANANQPLWVFSLNHDLIIECLAAKHGIPVNSGFPDAASLPLPGFAPSNIEAQVLTKKMLTTMGLPFFQGRFGINLFKLHGSLDMFRIRDGEDYLKLIPIEQSVSGVIKTLKIVNDTLPYRYPGNPELRISNEITYMDHDGELQFLRRSILAGAFKYREEIPKLGVYDMLDHFKADMCHVSKLVAIGYSFGDTHVNSAIRDWLELSGSRTLDIVDPYREGIPNDILHLAPQVTLHKVTASDYLEQFSSNPLSAAEHALRKALSQARRVTAIAPTHSDTRS
jgi:hypothetical protein